MIQTIHPSTGKTIFFNPVDTSSSEIKTFNQCTMAWFMKYVLRQRPKSTKTVLAIGGIMHDVLAAYYEPTTPDEDRDLTLLIELLKDNYQERLTMNLTDPKQEVFRTLARMVTGYWTEFGGKDWTMMDTEVNFRIAVFLRNRLVGFLHGRLDGTAVLKDDQIWIIDHKTTKQFRTAHFTIDPQIDLYCLAGSKLFGDQFGGLIINYIRSKVSKKSPNFQRIPVVRSRQALSLIEHNLGLKLLEMGRLDPSQIHFSPKKDCTWMCDFFNFCQGIRAGVSPKILFERSYKTRPRLKDDEYA